MAPRLWTVLFAFRSLPLLCHEPVVSAGGAGAGGLDSLLETRTRAWPTMSDLAVLQIDSAREYRGGQQQVRLLVEGLTRAPGIRQALVAGAGSRLATEVRRLGLPVLEVPWEAAVDPRAIGALARLLQARWEVIHAHEPIALQTAAFAQALCGSGAPLVATRRSTHVVRSPWMWSRPRLVVAVSRAVRDGMLGRGIAPSRIRLVPDGVPIPAADSRQAGSLREAAGAPPDAPLVGAVGALDRDKGHDVLIRAAARVTARRPEVRFVIVGEGPERTRLASLIAELALEGNVSLPGHVPDVAGSLRDLDLFVHPARREGLGTACLEAMAAGVPAVLSSAGGLTDVAGDLIPTVPPEDDQVLAGEILKLLEDPELRDRRAIAGRKRAREFSVERMVSGNLRCYREAAWP